MTDSSTPPTTDGVARPTEAILSRFSLLISMTPPISALLITLSSDSLSTTWMLWVATALCTGGLVVAFLSLRRTRERKQARQFMLTAISSVAALGCAWTFAFRDEIRFSRLVTSFSSAPAVLIDSGISRSILLAKATGAPPRRLASFLNSLVQEPHRARICSPAVCGEKNVAFAIAGVITETKFSLNVSVPEEKPEPQTAPNPAGLSEVLGEIDAPQYLLSNRFDARPLRLQIIGSPPILGETLQAAYHLVAAAQLGRTNDAAVDSHLRSFMELVRVLPSNEVTHDWILDGVLHATSHYLLTKDYKRSLEVVHAGHEAFPHEARLQVAEAYVQLIADDMTAAQAALPAASQRERESPLLDTMRGVLAAREGDFWQAARYFESATKVPSHEEPRRQFALHAAVAMLTSMTTGNPAQRGTTIVEHAERANELYHDVRLIRLLTAFGYALRRNVPAYQQIFDTLRRSRTGDNRIACDYWLARAYAETGREAEALVLLKPYDESNDADASLLGLLAELTMTLARDPRSVETAVRLAKRAREMNPAEAKSNRVLGLYLVGRSVNQFRIEKEAFEQQALSHLLAAIQGGGADPDVYLKVSDIYRDLAKAAPSRQSSRKSVALACNPGGDALSCRVLKIRDSLDASDVAGAVGATNDMLQWLDDNQGAVGLAHQSSMLVQAAIAWYEYGNAKATSGSGAALRYAEHLYNQVARNLERSGEFPDRRSILSTVDCNLGFIYVDQGQTKLAIQAFKRALQFQRVPDCEAGLAIALKQAGQDTEAIQHYRTAKMGDATYEENLDVLQRTNFWSAAACNILAQLSREEKGATATQVAAR